MRFLMDSSYIRVRVVFFHYSFVEIKKKFKSKQDNLETIP